MVCGERRSAWTAIRARYDFGDEGSASMPSTGPRERCALRTQGRPVVLPVELGDAQEFLTPVPPPLAERVPEDERQVLAADQFRSSLGNRARALASRIEHEVTAVGLHMIRPRAVMTAFEEGAGTMSRSQAHRLTQGMAGDESRSAANLVGADTTVIEVGMVLPAERDLAASCIRRAAEQPLHRSNDPVLHANGLRRERRAELITEAVP